MRINNNVIAINTHRQYGVNVSSVAKSTEKLSSGYRVNRAGDDAAGLAISEKMRAQIRGLNMASKNSSDAISLVQTAEGALQETHNILQRMRELAVQSASDTNEESIDRAALNAEFQQLIKEIDDTAKKTRFNDMGVIDGSYSGSVVAGGGIPEWDETSPTTVGITAGTGLVDTGSYQIAVSTSGTGPEGLISITLTNGKTGETVGYLTLTNEQIETFKYQKGDNIRLQLNDGTAIRFEAQADLTSASLLATAIGGTSFDFDWEGKPITIQTGANQGDELRVNIAAMDAEILGVDTLSIATRLGASKAITRVNDAVNFVSTQRATLGALQNRLNHKIMNLDTSAENLAAAESRIRDLDMAKEMTTFTRNNILVQASTSMLAQANMIPQSVLSLIG